MPPPFPASQQPPLASQPTRKVRLPLFFLFSELVHSQQLIFSIKLLFPSQPDIAYLCLQRKLGFTFKVDCCNSLTPLNP